MAPKRGFTYGRPAIIGAIIGALWCAVAPTILYTCGESFTRWDNLLYDAEIRLRADSDVCPHIAHLDIDDAAIEKIGQWPWDRRIAADIVHRLTELGAKAILFDVLYTTKGKTEEGDKAFISAVRDAGNVALAVSPIRVSRGKASAEIEESAARRVETLYDRSGGLDIPKGFNLYNSTELRVSGLPLPGLITGARRLGHIYSALDPDGLYRKTPLIIKLKDRILPSLSLAGLLLYLDTDLTNTRLDPQGYIIINYSDGALSIPVDDAGCMTIDWGSVWKRFPHYSVLDIFSDEDGEKITARYKDKIVIVGAAWTGMTDMAATPVDAKTPGSLVHSNSLHTILSGRYTREISPFPYAIIVAVLSTLLFIIYASQSPILQGTRTAVLIVVVYFVAVLVAFFGFSWRVPFFQPSFVFVPSAAFVLVSRWISMEYERRVVRDMFGRYVSEEIVSEIMDGKITLKGELREITTVVCDLRGFTAMTALLAPTMVLEIVNRYFERMTDVILKHEGTIDAFTGDGILVFFGAPRHMTDHAYKAVACALDMQEAMGPFNEESRRLGQPELGMGIGINTGEVVLGDVGSEKRRSYTAIGGPINIAFRVEAQAAGGEILVTPWVCENIPDTIHIESERETRLKGIPEPVKLFSVVGLQPREAT